MSDRVGMIDGALDRLPEPPSRWAAAYRRHLLNFVLPFWPRHGRDEEAGGLFTCIDDAGRLLSTDKYMWSQARALWTFSAVHRRIDSQGPWLEMARSQFDFCRRHGPLENQLWKFKVTRTGQTLIADASLATSDFAILGLVEFARAAQTAEPLELAYRAFQAAFAALRSGRPFGQAPYALPPGMKAHGAAMCAALSYFELGEQLGDGPALEASQYFFAQITREFIRPELRGLVEFVDLKGRFCDTPEGRAMVPGHGIESMWFLLDIARRSGNHADIALILQALEWCLERGWDDEFGGIRLGIDILGKTPVYWKHGDFKLWWPVTEAMIATLMAYEVDPASKWLDWHRRIVNWALARYPVPEHGEWRQRLDPQGRPYEPFLVLPVKDPFHLPRGLILSIEALTRLQAKKDPAFA